MSERTWVGRIAVAVTTAAAVLLLLSTSAAAAPATSNCPVVTDGLGDQVTGEVFFERLRYPKPEVRLPVVFDATMTAGVVSPFTRTGIVLTVQRAGGPVVYTRSWSEDDLILFDESVSAGWRPPAVKRNYISRITVTFRYETASAGPALCSATHQRGFRVDPRVADPRVSAQLKVALEDDIATQEILFHVTYLFRDQRSVCITEFVEFEGTGCSDFKEGNHDVSVEVFSGQRRYASASDTGFMLDGEGSASVTIPMWALPRGRYRYEVTSLHPLSFKTVRQRGAFRIVALR